jgi:hypothetical protein
MITQERLKELLDYDPATGVFVWKVTPSSSAPAGSVAGCRRRNGYIFIKVDGVQSLAHRLAWLYMTGVGPSDQIDHRNCIRDDNRFENLRASSRSKNQHNKALQKNNTSGIKGVSLCAQTGKWRAAIMADKIFVYLGLFVCIEDAAAAYAEASARLHKDFGRLA